MPIDAIDRVAQLIIEIGSEACDSSIYLPPCDSVALELGTRAPMKAAKQLRVPTLVQIADFDRSAPPQAAAKAAFRARAEVRHYPCDHFDVWPGKAWFDAASAHQVAFLTRVLG